VGVRVDATRDDELAGGVDRAGPARDVQVQANLLNVPEKKKMHLVLFYYIGRFKIADNLHKFPHAMQALTVPNRGCQIDKCQHLGILLYLLAIYALTKQDKKYRPTVLY
jgi:hypothetical protein